MPLHRGLQEPYSDPDVVDEYPEPRDCSPFSPCDYGDSDCAEWGDDGCDGDLVCGVDNCDLLIEGWFGNCCVNRAKNPPPYSPYFLTEESFVKKQIEGWIDSDEERYFVKDPKSYGKSEAVPGGFSEWGPWERYSIWDDWLRMRRRVFWPESGCGRQPQPFNSAGCATRWYQTEIQELE